MLIPLRNPIYHRDTALYPFQVSGHSLVNHENPVNNVKSKNFRTCGSESPLNKAYKVIIIGDSHMRNCAANVKSGMSNVKSNINDNIVIQGVVKPGALTSVLINSAQQDLNGLSKKDMVVFCGSTNDISINNSTQALHHIKEFVENNTHTNIALLTAPPTHDLMRSSYENSAVTTFNSKLKEFINAHQYASLINVDTSMIMYTTHGLHMNSEGKEKLANQLVSHILTVLEKKECPHLLLDHHPVRKEIVLTHEETRTSGTCKSLNSNICEELVEPPATPHSPAVASTTYNDGTTTGVTPDSNNDTKEEEKEKCEPLVTTVHKQEIAPKRVKKQPVTRGNDFLWEI